MIFRFEPFAVLLHAMSLGGTVAHGNHGHGHDHHHHHHGHGDDDGRGLRGPPGGAPPGQCKDGEPTFTVGGKTYECLSEFQAAGGRCHTQDHTPEERAAVADDFRAWLEKKGQGKGPKHTPFHRQLQGCGGDCVNWEAGQVITVPVNFHIFHDGNTGKQFICKYVQGSGFTEIGGNCQFIKDQIQVLNDGFRGVNQDGQPTQYNDDVQIQFCLQGANDIGDVSEYDNAGHYNDNGGSQQNGYKGTFRRGGMETLNVWVGSAGGYLGYAYFPSSNVGNIDGIVLLGGSMPNGGVGSYQEGDTLTHEVGHWLELEHTFNGRCSSSTGDYNDLAGFTMIRESTATSGCPANKDTCSGDGGPDPIHNFMDYSVDTCMDEFNPGQSIQMHFAWETYRHEIGESETWNVAADGVSCTQQDVPTANPTPSPTNAPVVPTPSPTPGPTPSPIPAPTNAPTPEPTSGPTFVPVPKYICRKNDPGDAEICLNGSFLDGNCASTDDNAVKVCGNGGKVCQIANCPGSGPGPTPPTPPSPTPPTSCPVCGNGAECCAPDQCETSGKPTDRACLQARRLN